MFVPDRSAMEAVTSQRMACRHPNVESCLSKKGTRAHNQHEPHDETTREPAFCFARVKNLSSHGLTTLTPARIDREPAHDKLRTCGSSFSSAILYS